MYSGTMIRDLKKIVEVVSADWADAYFADGGTLVIPAWIIIARVRMRLADGAAKDGKMSPDAVEAWHELSEIQYSLMQSEPLDEEYANRLSASVSGSACSHTNVSPAKMGGQE